MTIDLISKSQEGDKKATLLMIRKFNPLLKKYANKLFYEDAYNDLLIDFIELLHNINIANLRKKSEGSLVSYMQKSIYRSFLKRLDAKKESYEMIHFSTLTEGEMYCVEFRFSTCDEYFQNELPDIHQNLSGNEISILEMIYCLGYSSSDVALIKGISRQAVNQTKNRALKKMKACC